MSAVLIRIRFRLVRQVRRSRKRCLIAVSRPSFHLHIFPAYRNSQLTTFLLSSLRSHTLCRRKPHTNSLVAAFPRRIPSIPHHPVFHSKPCIRLTGSMVCSSISFMTPLAPFDPPLSTFFVATMDVSCSNEIQSVVCSSS